MLKKGKFYFPELCTEHLATNACFSNELYENFGAGMHSDILTSSCWFGNVSEFTRHVATKQVFITHKRDRLNHLAAIGLGANESLFDKK